MRPPLPVRFYLGVAWSRPDLRWIGRVLSINSPGLQAVELDEITLDADRVNAAEPNDAEPVASWLAWTAQDWDAVDPTARLRWLRAGVSRKLILALGSAGYAPEEVVAHAMAVNRTPDAAARTIREWLDAGFHPTPASLTALAATGIPARTVPSRAAVERVKQQLESDREPMSDTDLALLLAEHGTVSHTVLALRGQVHAC